MADQATVLLVKSTGHVLATLTRAGDPGGTLTPDALAGDRFPVRSSTGGILVEIEAAALDVQSVPLIDDLLIQPQNCLVDQGQAQLETATIVSAVISGTGVVVTVAAAVSKETPVWVQADTGAGSTREHTILEGKIPQNGTTITLANTFARGTYDVLALVPGNVPYRVSRTF
jgi:hypothetical protein